jgi:hypothetical protein
MRLNSFSINKNGAGTKPAQELNTVSIYNARKLWSLSVDEIWSLPDGPLTLEMDDGLLDTTMRATVFSYYLGEFHRQYPMTPLLMKHHLGDRQIKKGIELKILGDALWECRDTYGPEVDMEELSYIAYQTVNRIYNDFTVRLKAWVSTISILDFIDAAEHPPIKEANALLHNPESLVNPMLLIDQNHTRIVDALLAPGELKGNTIARMAKSELVDIKQIEQCLGARGYVTDIDSNIFKQPILSGYLWGMRTLYDSMVESRSASKALDYAKDPVAESEYFNREMQLVASVLTRLHLTDCGSTDYLLFKVQKSDLSKLAGKYYRLDDGRLQVIHRGDIHLAGKVLQLRSALKCHHPDAYGVCSTCFGELADSIPRYTNLGHVAVTLLCEIISQIVLSIKHLDGSSKVDDFYISDFDRKYIRSGEEVSLVKRTLKEDVASSTVIKLASRLAGKKVLLVISGSQTQNLSEIHYHPVENLAVSSITSLSEIWLKIADTDEFVEEVKIPVSMGTRYSWLTVEALKYIKQHGLKLTNNGSYQIDLSHWDVDLPLFQLPLKHADMVQYMKTIKSFIMASGKPGRNKVNKMLKDFPTVDQGLLEFYKLISSKLHINLAYLEVIILSAMVRSEKYHDHRLPRPIADGELGSYRRNMNMRSAGQWAAYERQDERLMDIRSFTVKNRPDSSFDTLLMPFPYANPTE